MTEKKYRYLDRVNSPADLKALPHSAMRPLAAEIRSFLCENVPKTGGHLASNLGVVEISMAIHRVFDSPRDHILYDVGHQSYIHKILTGRRDRFDTLRQPGGLSGFTSRRESEHDPFGAGHSSTSVSAAIGFAEADLLAGRDNFTVAVIGDGAFTGGMVHEALNNCHENLRLILILNENEMSISKNIGSFAEYIAKIRSSETYSETKDKTRRFTQNIPLIGNGLYDAMCSTKQVVKDLLYSSNYFEQMGLFYLGPVDGNDYDRVESLLKIAKSSARCSIIHLKTKKGCGYAPAEQHPERYHSISPHKCPDQTFSTVMGETLSRMASHDRRLCAVTAAMKDGTGLALFAREHKKRFFDVGIAEDHALTFGAGLAADGMKPFVAIYSSFLQRGYDSLVHDIGLQSLPVTVMIDRAGLACGDGPTHHGIFDVAFLSQIPDFQIFAPAVYLSLKRAMRIAAESNSPCAIRYENRSESRDILDAFYPNGDDFSWVHADYTDPASVSCVIVTYGRLASQALLAEAALKAGGIGCGVILLERLTPYDTIAAQLSALLPDGADIIFAEEGIRCGGAAMILKDRITSPDFALRRRGQIAIRAIENPYALPMPGESWLHAHRLDSDSLAALARKLKETRTL